MARPEAKVYLGDFSAILSELNVKKLRLSKETGVSRATVYRLAESGEATPEICLRVVDYLLAEFGSKGLQVLRKFADKSYIQAFSLHSDELNQQKIAAIEMDISRIEGRIRDVKFRSLDDEQKRNVRQLSRRLDRLSRDLEYKI